tara:strand:+ start:750 stop:1430 length:681 start_codon:yes stop_codon:yes gene_type:complete
MADAGFDWLCIDLEHSVIDYFEAEQLIATMEAKGCIPYVRVGENNPLIIKRMLDAGAVGIIVPAVNSKEDAIRAVKSVKYPPLGNRGVGLARAQNYGFGFDEYVEKINSRTMVIVQIEHIDAINNLEEILSTKGVDGSIIGPYDLSGSMGKPGEYNEPDVKKALEKYERLAKDIGKPFGYHVIEPDYKLVLEKIDLGYTIIAFSLDTLFLGSICRNQMDRIKEHFN